MGRLNILGKLSVGLSCVSFILVLILLYGVYEGHHFGGWNFGPSDELVYSLAGAFAVLGVAGIVYAFTQGSTDRDENVGLGLRTPPDKR